MEIRNKVIKSAPYEWRNFKFIQSEHFKNFPPQERAKLRESLIRNEFSQSFKCWQSGKDVYCLDGYHRCLVLKQLEGEGYEIPKLLPCEFIECKDKSEAAKLVLVYSSTYTTINKDALSDIIDGFSLDVDLLGEEISLNFGAGGLGMDEELEQAGPPVPEYPIVSRFSERYDYVVVFCKNDIDFTNLCELMQLKTERSTKNSSVGVGRVIPFERFMALWKLK